jgi:hypothetical protein
VFRAVIAAMLLTLAGCESASTGRANPPCGIVVAFLSEIACPHTGATAP